MRKHFLVSALVFIAIPAFLVVPHEAQADSATLTALNPSPTPLGSTASPACTPDMIGKKIRSALLNERGIDGVTNLYASTESAGVQSRAPFFFKSKTNAYIGTIPFNLQTCETSAGVSVIRVVPTEKPAPATPTKKHRRRRR